MKLVSDGVATATYDLDQAVVNAGTYVIAFVCSWQNDQWLCGCESEACAQNGNRWNVQAIQR